jgi:Transposase
MLSLKAMHGGKAKNDKIDSQKIAALLRGGMLPQADVSPAEMRATRDLLRRRPHLMRQRAALLAHGQNINSQYHLPEIGKKIAYKAHREGVAERCTAPAVPKTMEVALALITSYDQLLSDLELSSLQTAKHHDANRLYRRHTVPGLGTSLSLVLPPGSMCQGSRWEAPGHLRHQNRQRAPQGGFFRSCRPVFAEQPCGAKPPRSLGEKTCQRQSAEQPGA